MPASWHDPVVDASPGRNRNRLSLGKVAGEQTLVSTGISFASSGDDRPEIPFEDDLSCETAVRFGDLSVMAVASGDSDLLAEDDLAARFTVDCAAPSQAATDILALILAARSPPAGSGDPDSRTRKCSVRRTTQGHDRVEYFTSCSPISSSVLSYVPRFTIRG